ncbi:MAG: hypothetical protein M3442_21315, partial [Chloroflexota bacterium]|nr:hypothetical protein [Chloroflexota bacterium]
TDFDPGKIATATVAGWNALDPEARATVTEAVHVQGGYFLEIEPGDDGTVTLRMAGVAVARVPTWRLLKAPEMPAADA